MGAAIQLPFVEHTVPSAASSDDRESQSGALDWQGTTLSFEVHGNQMHHSIWSLGHRFGEAQHPGPHQSLVLGCTNGGLRNKEALAVAQGPGIWTYSETHLSSITQVSSGKALKHAARQENRLLRPFFSAPAPLRSRSDWAGTWTGVVCTSDFCSKQLQVEWPPDLWNSGRVLATQHQIGTHSITVVSLYGLPRGPTWPRAATIMNDILAFISKTFVFGHSGLVAICGDFNFSPHELEHFNIWRSAGWCSAQELATTRWDHVWTPTCKGATERDIIWLSPAAASLCTGLHIEDVFCDHSSISVTLDLAEAPTTVLTWPRPQEINWEQVDVAGWHAHCSDCTMEVDPDSTVHMTNFAQHFENSLNGYVGQPGSDLQSAQKGRSKRLKPAKQTLQPTTCRASRPGEVALTQDLVGTAVLQWFRQLRRIQSYCHSIKAGRLHNEAVVYRAELWTSIKRASGFQHGFAYWWDQQEFFHAVGPLPLHPPGAAIAKRIYEAFHHAFRAFERWHLAQKNRLIQTKYEKATQAIFKDLRDPSPDQIDSLWTSKAYQVIAVREESKAVLLDDGIRPLPGSTWYHNGCGLTVDGYIDEMLVFKHLPLTSDVGFAEGDPLSVPAMAILDWALHVYQSQYAPLTRTMSFVDNISMLSRQVMTLVWAFFSLHAFLELWGLEIDLDKSYSWSTTPQTRAQLAPLGLRVVEDVSELGGSLTFSSAARVRIFLKRGAKLEQKWARLRISKAPLAQKLMVLPMVFWASALHGALGCIFAESHLHHLRKKAVAALGLKTGGSNPLLRLTLAQPHTADPGFYHLRHCIFDFRRICSKTPDLTVQWRQFMRLYSGRKLPGPFYKIVELFSQIGWSIVVPPFFTDHDGFVHNLYDVPNSTLDALLFDAWLQHVAVQVQHRRTMHDLCGIDPELTLLDRAHMTALELGRTMALQCGAFLSDWHQAKFDPAKQQICQLCLVPNTQRHWFVCPHFDNVRTEIMEPFNWISEIPDCTVSHLLVPRNPYAVEFKSYFLSLEDATGSFHSEPGEGLQNLFSDGSFFPGIPKIAGVGAWSLVNATSGQVIGAGPLHGLTQSIARAELCGALAAIKWVAHFQTMACLWCDSKHVVDGLQALLDGRWTTQDSICENHDLWQQAEAMLADIPDGHFQVNWTPSHLDFVQCESTWEEWLATWNAIADSLAVSVNEARSYEYNDLQYKAQQRSALWSERLRLIRKFFWTVADSKARDEEVIDLTASEVRQSLGNPLTWRGRSETRDIGGDCTACTCLLCMAATQSSP
ncbi:unnamed protein product [Cladocopium goreaui]|uniref:Reverse transcriptase domain-containing protein n=1 Tax=Cladocopium goreaui TaxID=2562237 RepID=A0A9P1DVU9_9DINO|nr:unnamed protein product [Cladocopium goreaui]